MGEVGASEAKYRLGALLDQVERGQEIVITRRGKPVARLIPAAGFDRDRGRRAVARILRASRGGGRLDGLRIKDLIEEGRE